MRYRALGNTGLMVSEIGLGAEWLERHNAEEVKAVIDCCEAQGINILDCWMPEPKVRSNIGAAIAGKRSGGSSRGTSAPPGRTASTSAPGTWTRWCPPLRICWSGCAPTTSTWA